MLYTKQQISMQKTENRSQKSELMRELRGHTHTHTTPEEAADGVDDREEAVPRPAANICSIIVKAPTAQHPPAVICKDFLCPRI